MKEKIYKKLPIAWQNIACDIQGQILKKERLSGKFYHYLDEYLERDKWSIENICKYRDQRIHNLIIHSYETVPYYKNLFDELKLKPDDFNSIEDLKKLPILTKDEVRKAGDSILSSKFKKSQLTKASTSGSTGSGLSLYYPNNLLKEQFALWWKYRIKIGINLDMWCADFGSRTIVPINQNEPPFWRTSKSLKQVKFSAFHGTPDNYYHYYKEIKRRGLRWIHGYPSVITPFAAYLISNNLSLVGQIDFVTTGGENLYDFQKETIQKAFGVKPYSHYGLGECVANISEDINHNLIVDEDFAAVEFVEDGGLYKIVGTSLANYAMPLIRYDTGDLAVADAVMISKYPRSINFIDGRNGEYILLKSGKKVGALSALFSDTVNIIQAQLHQKLDYSLDIFVVCDGDEVHIQDDLDSVKERLEARIGNEINYKFIKVPEIKRTKRGKQRYIISDFESEIKANVRE